jgi:phosphoribosylanthranilate isomerase
MVRVKTCGITRREDALVAMEAGVHALGLVFHPESPRFIAPSQARRMIVSLPPLVSWVGVFVNQYAGVVLETARQVGLDTLQLHGEESRQECHYCLEKGFRVIKAIRVALEKDLKVLEGYRGAVSAILLDTRVTGEYGGTGRTFPWKLARQVKDIPIILAGGLNPGNVAQAIAEVHPWGVDVSSGVEMAPGLKAPGLIREFMNNILRRRIEEKGQ